MDASVGVIRRVVAVLCVTIAAGGVTRRLPCQSASAPAARTIEGSVFHHWVTGPYGAWDGAALRVSSIGARQAWYADAVAEHAFGDRGVFGAVTYRRELNERVFAIGSFGVGQSTFVFPRFRGDGSLGARWGARRSFVTTLGATFVEYRDGHEDAAATLSATSYFGPAAVEVGARVNRSTPGDVTSTRTFVAFTLRADARNTLTVRGDVGNEGYQRFDVDRALVAFASRSAQIGWRTRVSARWGLALGIEAYDNAFYTRTGVTGGVTRAW